MVKANRGRWTPQEISIFNHAVKLNMTWKQVAQLIGTRTAEQCRSHNQKMKLYLFNRKTNSQIMYFLYRINKGTQYEPQREYSTNIDTIFEPFDVSNDTAESDEIEMSNFECISLCEELL
ncbi:hypothetical protein SteCoe_2136 [Stentor coeruleus]|uniref:Uncharacterized protein n=1 Tax=Stentor coeruleus TaxID=5963 RepID=A0A1R2D062_9CILI|nr:hypothetical protein SteCoe_2136 [Stentor coeruleus]